MRSVDIVTGTPSSTSGSLSPFVQILQRFAARDLGKGYVVRDASGVPNAPRAVVAGSERRLAPGATRIGDADGSQMATVSVVLRPRQALPADGRTMTRHAFASAYGAAEDDVAAVVAFAAAAGLETIAVHRARRTVEFSGSIAELCAAFGVAMARYRGPDDQVFRGREGALTVPAALAPIVRGVFGLDDRVQARAQFRRAASPAVMATAGFTPLQVATAYGFPDGDGAGQTIALIELGGGYKQSDLTTYFRSLGIATPTVVSVAVDGGSNTPTGDANGPDAEVCLDIEVAGSIAPAAKIVVYFAPNTDRGFLDAVTTAVHDTTHAPTIISISWGGAESTWTAQATQSFDDAFSAAATLGITVTCAAGDNGSSDGVTDGRAHVDFPASSPHVLACGGTRLTIAGTIRTTEVVWNDGTDGGATGGGISDVFALPPWQATAHVPPSANPGARVGRGVPDVCGNADPDTGYRTFVDGSAGVIGGTSAVAPLWAGLVARINAKRGSSIGFINPQLYGSAGTLLDVTSGNNGAYSADVGWDACTGLGSPDGARINALFASSVTVTS